MSLPKPPSTLGDSDIQEIEQFARGKLTECNKLNDVIGSQIFQILGRYSRVLYYPLDDEDIWGFVEKTTKGCFVCINTSITYDKQVFVAAHELYHIWYNGCDEELILAKNIEDLSPATEPVAINELKANRFAAAFLVDDALLRQEMRLNGITKESLDIKGILRLANLFVVPYKTMVRRLSELQIIDKKYFNQYMSKSHTEIEVLMNRMGLLLPNQKNAISLDNLVEVSMSLFDQHRITAEKLEQILRYANLTLEDVGVKLETAPPLTDEEIEKLLEE